MKILKRIIISAAAFLLLNFASFAQSQLQDSNHHSGLPDGVKLFLETEKPVLQIEQNYSLASRATFQKDILFYGINENFHLNILQFQKLKTVSNDLVKRNALKLDFVKLQAGDNDTTFKKKSSFWSNDLLYFSAGVIAAAAAYFLISGTSAATSSQKTFGYPPPPSN
ncbi:MAG: hypothetical protein GXO87_09670 [Chlorobi bacterium]|nr:hypothetical protein [Chlorobiota bacterium]